MEGPKTKDKMITKIQYSQALKIVNDYKGKAMGSHQSARSVTNEWLTDPKVVESLGPFDLDPCAPVNRPWDTAKKHYTIEDNGLIQPWEGRVWCNPPYGNHFAPFIEIMARHGSGISLLFARTDRNEFHRSIFPYCDSVFFIKQRLTFYYPNGERAKANGGAPNVLISYSEYDTQKIKDSGINGSVMFPENRAIIVVVGFTGSWRHTISIAITRLCGKAEITAIYEEIKLLAPEKVKNNKHFKEKIRQKLQAYFTRVQRGVYSNN